MRALVTGGAGFIGSHVVAELVRREADVRVIDNFFTGTWENLERSGLPFSAVERCDIRSPRAADVIRRWRPDVLVHLAAQVNLPRAEDNPAEDKAINVDGTENLLTASVSAGVRQVVFAASCAIYGWVPEHGLPVREGAYGGGLGNYGRNKQAALDLLERFRDEHGLDYTALVLGNVYGPRPAHEGAGVVRHLAEAVLRGRPPVIHGDGNQTRDFVHVDDVVRAVLRAMTPTEVRKINIGSGVGTRILDVLRLVNLAAGRHVPPLHDRGTDTGVDRMALDITIAEKVLGWRPSVGLSHGVRTVVRAAGQDVRPQVDAG